MIAVQFGLITCMGVFNPVFATYRLEHTATDRVARTLSAWSITSSLTVAALTALGVCWPPGRPARGDRGRRLLLLATPLLLRSWTRDADEGREGG